MDMKLEVQGVSKRLRYIVSLIMIFPIALTIISVILLGHLHATHLEEKYELTNIQFTYVPDSIHVYDKLTSPYFEELKLKAVENPETLVDSDYLSKINMEIGEFASYLIVNADGVITFIGDAQAYNILDKDALEINDGINHTDNYSTYVGGDYPVMVKCTQFEYEEGRIGSAYIITDLTQTIPESSVFIETVVLLMIISIVLTAFIIMMIIGRRYIRPLKKLEDTLIKIAQGNYEEKVSVEGTKEIQDMAQTIEAIKISLHNQRKLYLDQEDEMREVISNISHDLKTPITSIKGYAEGLRDGVANTEEKRQKYRKIILQKANEMDKLLNELTLYSKVHMKHMLYEFQTVNVKDYFDHCIGEFELDLEEHGIRLVYANYVADKTNMLADPAQLSRVKHNIINNSVKYMDKTNGVIIVSVAEVNDMIEIKFEDNGSGINHDELVHIFDRFYRSDKSRNSNTGGSGIGLSIAKDIVEEHKGKIWATSKEGVGTIMHIALPKITGDNNE